MPTFPEAKMPPLPSETEFIHVSIHAVIVSIHLTCHVVPCNAMPNVSLTFGGKSWNIAPKLFNLGRVSRGSNDCVGGIGASDAAG